MNCVNYINRTVRLVALLGAVTLLGCATAPAPNVQAPAPIPPPVAAPEPPAAPIDGAGAQGVVGRHERLLVAAARDGDTMETIAQRHLGSASLAWRLVQANPSLPERLPMPSGRLVVVPLLPPPGHGVTLDGVQTVPILCYHRFGSGPGKMVMSPLRFEAQLQWLAREGYKVLRLSELQAFLAAREAPPPRSVVITIDDGYESFHRHAFPLLRKYGMPATLFVYSDIIGRGDGISWSQLRELADSGLVDIQSHSKTHRNLNARTAQEGDAAYRQNLTQELRHPRQLLEQRLAGPSTKVNAFAYPYGESNDLVVDLLAREGYALGFTVHAGGNPFFASPRLLRRTMIYGDHDLDDFKARLQIRWPLDRPSDRSSDRPDRVPDRPADRQLNRPSERPLARTFEAPAATPADRR